MLPVWTGSAYNTLTSPQVDPVAGVIIAPENNQVEVTCSVAAPAAAGTRTHTRHPRPAPLSTAPACLLCQTQVTVRCYSSGQANSSIAAWAGQLLDCGAACSNETFTNTKPVYTPGALRLRLRHLAGLGWKTAGRPAASALTGQQAGRQAPAGSSSEATAAAALPASQAPSLSHQLAA